MISKWVKVQSLSRVWLLVTPWTVAYQASLSMGFSRQEYWSGLTFPSPGDLPHPGVEPWSPAMQADVYPLSHQGNPVWWYSSGFSFFLPLLFQYDFSVLSLKTYLHLSPNTIVLVPQLICIEKIKQISQHIKNYNINKNQQIIWLREPIPAQHLPRMAKLVGLSMSQFSCL